MLADRNYMREGSGGAMWPAAIVMMAVLVATFALQCINDVYLNSVAESYLAVTPLALLRGHVWQLFTFQFLHVDLWHLIGNLLGLWFFGRFVENVVGRNRFLFAYVGAGVIGGLFQVILMVLFPRHFPPFVFGASAGVMGVFAIFCKLESASEIRWNFILPIRADVLLWITMGISLFFTLVPSGRGGFVAHAAHLGGLLAGIGFVRLGWHQDFRPLPWVEWWQQRRAGIRVMRGPSRKPPGNSSRFESAPAPQDAPGDFMSNKVDPILDKISAHGIHSLTAEERAILEKAQKRMAKR